MLFSIIGLTLDIFSATISPANRFAVAHSESQGKDINHLILLPDQQIIATLKGFSAFESENHGGMFAMYSKSEAFVVIMQASKWRPRALSLVATANGAQFDLNDRLQVDASSFFKTPANKPGFIFDVLGARFDNNKVSFAIIGQSPSDPDRGVVYGSVSYPFTLAKTKLSVGKPVMRRLTESSVWKWPSADQ